MITIHLDIVKAIAGVRAANYVLGRRFEQGMREAGEFVLEKSQEIVPLDTGRLHDTGVTYNAGGKGWDADQVVAYGPAIDPDNGFDYSLRQHEDRSLHHPYPRQAKFISDPIKWYRLEILNIIKRKLKRG